MTILDVQEQRIQGKRYLRRTLAEGDVGSRTFIVLTDDPTHSEYDIIAAVVAFDPSTGPLALFPGSSTAQCVDQFPTQPWNDTTKWLVTFQYKSNINQAELDRGTEPDPTERRTVVTGTSRTIMIPARRLLRTVPYKLWSEAGPGATWDLGYAVNSASDPLDPPIDVATTEWELHAEKNVETLPSWFLTYGNGVNTANQATKVNGVTFTIPKACGKLSNFKFSETKRENGVDYIRIAWDCTVRFPRDLFSTETDYFGPWDEERLDEGMRRYDLSGKWDGLRDKSGHTLQLPVPFNGTGGPINVTGAPIAQTDLWYIGYRPHGDRRDYSVMPWE